MKAAVFKGPGRPMVIEQIADPEPQSNEVVIAVHSCGICGTDLHWSESRDASAGWRTLEPGTVMGHEFAGEIVEVGADARSQWQVGDRICALPFIGCGRCSACRGGRPYRCDNVIMRATERLHGAYAEYTRVGAAEALRLPESVDSNEGALVEPLAVGLSAVRRARFESGDRVLIVGAGPVGLSVALWCRFFGARHIVVSDLVAPRAERSIGLGATAIIDASREDVRSRFEELTGAPPRIVFDCVGVPGSLQLSIDYAGRDSHVVVVGLCMAADTFFPAKAITKELDLSFAFVYSRADFEMVIGMLVDQRIPATPLITQCVGFNRFPAAFEALKKPSDQIKVLLDPRT